MSMKNLLTPAGIEPVTFRFVAQHLNHCTTACFIVFCEIITFSKATLKNSEITKLKFHLACDNVGLDYCSSLWCHEDESSMIFPNFGAVQ